MNDVDLQVFVTGATRYFEQVAGTPPFVDSPYLLSTEEDLILDYTGVIEISGVEKGFVFFSARRPMVDQLMKVLGEKDRSRDNCRDLVGEVANTISGNARELFGQEFQISVPTVFEGGSRVRLPSAGEQARTYVIPIVWQGYRSHLIIAMET